VRKAGCRLWEAEAGGRCVSMLPLRPGQNMGIAPPPSAKPASASVPVVSRRYVWGSRAHGAVSHTHLSMRRKAHPSSRTSFAISAVAALAARLGDPPSPPERGYQLASSGPMIGGTIRDRAFEGRRLPPGGLRMVSPALVRASAAPTAGIHRVLPEGRTGPASKAVLQEDSANLDMGRVSGRGLRIAAASWRSGVGGMLPPVCTSVRDQSTSKRGGAHSSFGGDGRPEVSGHGGCHGR
jgi:hypothetical protein